MNVFNCPRGMERVLQQLVVWFGGRILPNDDLLGNCFASNKNFDPKSKLKNNLKSKGKGRNCSVTSKNNY